MKYAELPEGYTVKYTHGRFENRDVLRLLGVYLRGNFEEYREAFDATPTADRRDLDHPSTTGGVTTAVIYDTDGNEVARGVARCGVLDNYSRRIGRDISRGRALKNMKVTA